MVDTFGTSALTREQLTDLVRRHFDLTPYGLREMLDDERSVVLREHRGASRRVGRRRDRGAGSEIRTGLAGRDDARACGCRGVP